MKFLKLMLFSLLFNFCKADGFESLEWGSRITMGTVATVSGLAVCALMARLDLIFMGGKNYKPVARQVKKSGIYLQQTGDWIKDEATSTEVFALTIAAIVAAYYEAQFTWSVLKSTFNYLTYPFRSVQIEPPEGG